MRDVRECAGRLRVCDGSAQPEHPMIRDISGLYYNYPGFMYRQREVAQYALPPIRRLAHE